MRFMAMFSAPCASGESAPRLMPGVRKRFLNGVDAFDLLDGDGRAVGGEVQKVAERDGRLIAQGVGVGLEGGVVASVAGGLQAVDQVGLEGVGLAPAALAVEAADGERAGGLPGPKSAPPAAVQLQRPLLQPGEPDAGDARGHAGEGLGHHGAAEAHRLEVVASAIGRDDADAHLGQNLQEARLHRRLVVQAHVAQGQGAGKPALLPILEGFLRQVGVHRRGPHAHQHRKGVGVDGLGRAHDQRHVAAQPLAHEVAVHRPHGQDHRHGHGVVARGFVGEHDLRAAGKRRLLRLFAQAGQGVAERHAGDGVGGGRGHDWRPAGPRRPRR